MGKTTLTAILAHLFAEQGFRVLAVDGDPQQNLAVTLGIPPESAAKIVPVSQSIEYLQEKTGAGPGISPADSSLSTRMSAMSSTGSRSRLQKTSGCW